MDDLISRHAAIDALVKRTHLTWEDLKIIYPMLDVLEKLSSAQSERPSEVQDILDYLDTVLHPILSPEHWNVYSELYDMISMLPPAERRGSWVGIDDEPCDVWECDRCGHIVERECPPRFCEECGARMEVE